VAWEEATAVIASAARTTTGSSAFVPSVKALSVALLANVTAVSGTTPSMTLSIDWSMDGTTATTIDGTADTFTAITATPANSGPLKVFTVKAPFWRLTWTITGTTPSFTFAVLRYGIGS
jgi:hypothetical protein